VGFLDLIPRVAWQAAVAVLGALLVLQTVRLATAQLETQAEKSAHAKTKRDHATQVAAAALVTAEAEREQRRIETRRASLAQEIAHEHLRLDARNRAVAAALRADRDRLRDDLTAFVAGPGEAGGDSVAACVGRSSALGVALDEALRAEEEATGAAESCLAAAHGLHRWARELGGMAESP
jgi:hypothetical protein